MRKLSIVFISTILIAAFLSYYSSKQLFSIRSEQRESLEGVSLIPPQVVSAAAMEFKGITADYILLRVMTYLGSHLLARTEPGSDAWRHVHHLLQQVTTLDPDFWDPYVLAETMLVMHAGLVKEGNQLLEQAAANLPENYRPLFFLWYNKYYIEQDIESAERYLYEAIQKPDAPTYLAGIASRMSLINRRVDASILALSELMKETSNQLYREYLKKRIITIQIIDHLEKAIEQYKKQYNETPKDLELLVEKQLIKAIPPDPYGGKFYITPNGRVYTTSKMVQVK